MRIKVDKRGGLIPWGMRLARFDCRQLPTGEVSQIQNLQLSHPKGCRGSYLSLQGFYSVIYPHSLHALRKGVFTFA